MSIPIIDLFAGPGGLGEGFSSYKNSGLTPFEIALSIEKDPVAHQTLKLRSFTRQFKSDIPEEYYFQSPVQNENSDDSSNSYF